jgi:hypothetical protein
MFCRDNGIDIMAIESALTKLDLTPDVIPDVPVLHLCDVTGMVEGCAMKLQAYFREWYSCLDEKRLKRRHLT